MDRGHYGRYNVISPDAEMCLWVRKATRTDSTSGLAIVMRACFAETQARHRRCGGGGGGGDGGSGGDRGGRGGGQGQGGSSLGWEEPLALPECSAGMCD